MKVNHPSKNPTSLEQLILQLQLAFELSQIQEIVSVYTDLLLFLVKYSFMFEAENTEIPSVTSDPARDGVNWYGYCNNSPLNYKDSKGLAAGDPFATPDDAAKDWAETYADDSIFNQREFGSSIFYYFDENGNKIFSYNLPQGGYNDERGKGVDINRDVESGQTIVTGIHSHGDDDPNHYNNKSSINDRKGISKDKETYSEYYDYEYLVTPDGHLLKFNTKGIVDILREDLLKDISPDLRNIPEDSPEWDSIYDSYNKWRDENWKEDPYYD